MFTISRLIEIDAAHRVMTHGSKCRGLHGHRYKIEAVCGSKSGGLVKKGEETDMVMDFAFLKEEMMAAIDAPCDHGIILSVDDSELMSLFTLMQNGQKLSPQEVARQVAEHGYCALKAEPTSTKVYIIEGQPTAEVLARHWHDVLSPRVEKRSHAAAKLTLIRVYETPNSVAEYISEKN